MTDVVRSLLAAGRRRRPVPVGSPAGRRAPAPQLVQLTTHYTVRGSRVYQDAIYQHADGTLWRHFLPVTEAAA